MSDEPILLGDDRPSQKKEPTYPTQLREDITPLAEDSPRMNIPRPEPSMIDNETDGLAGEIPYIDSDEVAIRSMPLGVNKTMNTKQTREPDTTNSEILILKGRISELEDENDHYVDRINDLEGEAQTMAEELLIKPEVIRDGISNDDVNYLDNLLASAGVPDVMPDGTLMDLGDRIMFVVSQRSIIITGLQGMRSELTGIAHRTRKTDPELSDQMFELLRRSSQSTNLIAISEE